MTEYREGGGLASAVPKHDPHYPEAVTDSANGQAGHVLEDIKTQFTLRSLFTLTDTSQDTKIKTITRVWDAIRGGGKIQTPLNLGRFRSSKTSAPDQTVCVPLEFDCESVELERKMSWNTKTISSKN